MCMFHEGAHFPRLYLMEAYFTFINKLHTSFDSKINFNRWVNWVCIYTILHKVCQVMRSVAFIKPAEQVFWAFTNIRRHIVLFLGRAFIPCNSFYEYFLAKYILVCHIVCKSGVTYTVVKCEIYWIDSQRVMSCDLSIELLKRFSMKLTLLLPT